MSYSLPGGILPEHLPLVINTFFLILVNQNSENLTINVSHYLSFQYNLSSINLKVKLYKYGTITRSTEEYILRYVIIDEGLEYRKKLEIEKLNCSTKNFFSDLKCCCCQTHTFMKNLSPKETKL